MPRPGYRKTHCKNGHALIDGAIYIYNDKKWGPSQRCKTCKKDWERAKYKKMAQAKTQVLS